MIFPTEFSERYMRVLIKRGDFSQSEANRAHLAAIRAENAIQAAGFEIVPSIGRAQIGVSTLDGDSAEECLLNVASDSTLFLRETVRKDGFHVARMNQRIDAVLSSIRDAADASEYIRRRIS